MTTIIAWIIFGIVVVALVAWVETELLSTVYRAGYVRGMEDAGKMPGRCLEDAGIRYADGQEIRDEGRWS